MRTELRGSAMNTHTPNEDMADGPRGLEIWVAILFRGSLRS